MDVKCFNALTSARVAYFQDSFVHAFSAILKLSWFIIMGRFQTSEHSCHGLSRKLIGFRFKTVQASRRSKSCIYNHIYMYIYIYTQFSTYSIIQMQKKYGGDGDDDDEEEEDVSIMYIYPEPWPREDVLLLCKCLGGFSVTRVWCSLQRFWVVMDSGIGLLVLSLWFWARVSNVFSRDQWLRPFSRRFFLDFPL